MSSYKIQVRLNSVDVNRLVSEDDFQREADRQLPGVLTHIGEKIAECTWNELQKSLRRMPGIKINSSASDKARHIRSAGTKHRHSASPLHRQKIRDELIRQLHAKKAQAENMGSGPCELDFQAEAEELF